MGGRKSDRPFLFGKMKAEDFKKISIGTLLKFNGKMDLHLLYAYTFACFTSIPEKDAVFLVTKKEDTHHPKGPAIVVTYVSSDGKVGEGRIIMQNTEIWTRMKVIFQEEK